MSSSRKGKACIIAVPDYDNSNYDDLDGYNDDEESLTKLWTELGFDQEVRENISASVAFYFSFL